jgi:glutamate-1-semialdehyde 2,1-aminomutase
MAAYGPNLFGYGCPEIDEAAKLQLAKGDTLTGPSEIMVELAELFVNMVSHADWAIFCKNGTDATSMAILIARAHRGKRKILCARGAYHGAAAWCNPFRAGTLPEDRAHIVYYDYNDPESLQAAGKLHGGDIAGVFATPFQHEAFADQHMPTLEYAKAAQELSRHEDALLIVDDIRAGFRLSRDCSWSELGVDPDLSTWGKAIANGYPISALLGSDVAREAASKVFVTGSFWFSAVPMAAAIATLKRIKETDYLEHTAMMGTRLRAGLDAQARHFGFALRQTGPSQMPQILFEDDPDFRLGYAWVSACVEHGVYFSPYHNMFLTAAHRSEDIEETLFATEKAFDVLRKEAKSLGPVPQLEILKAMAG